MPNVYWTGTRRASLTRALISAPWGAPGTPHSGRSITFVNRAFEIYYLAKNNISRVTNTGHKQAMQRQLTDAARTGAGFGVDDLEEAFEHLNSHGGRWIDSETRSYFGGREKAFNIALVTGPKSIVNFMNAVDDKMGTLRSCLRNYERKKQELSSLHSQISRQRTGSATSGPWEQFGTVMGEIKSWGERAKPFLWLAPATQAQVGRVVSFADVISHIHSGMTTYARSLSSGMPTNVAVALGAARTAMIWVPVLGDFYGRAIDMIPGMKAWFEGILRGYHARIARETGMTVPRAR